MKTLDVMIWAIIVNVVPISILMVQVAEKRNKALSIVGVICAIISTVMSLCVFTVMTTK